MMGSYLVVLVICGLISGIQMRHADNTLMKDSMSNGDHLENSDEDTYDEIMPNYTMDESDEVTDEEIQQYMQILQNMTTSDYDPQMLSNILPGYGKTWMFYPDSDGTPTVVSLRAIPTPLYSETMYSTLSEVIPTRKPSDMLRKVQFHLYTRNNTQESQILIPENQDSISRSNLDVNKDIKVITHGWKSSQKAHVCQKLKNAYLKMHDVNVICVDWSPIASNTWYFTPSKETMNVGLFLADMLDFLITMGCDNKKMHLMGHSLGAHVSGYAGKFFNSGKIDRITGFDPAKLYFGRFTGSANKLHVTDAKFVDVIHTSMGMVGLEEPLGDVDFYPNSGKPPQPGCDGMPQVLEACSHSRSYEFYAEAIENPTGFHAVPCDSFDKFVEGNCDFDLTDFVHMGPSTPHSARGTFYLSTNKSPPFAQGPIDLDNMRLRG